MSTFERATGARLGSQALEVVAEFIRRVDTAAAVTERQRAAEAGRGAAAGRLAELDTLLGKLRGVRAAALAGTLPPSNGTLRLGFSRFVPEWNEVPEIADLMYPIDDFYEDHM